jgi:hypothetical protein
MRRIARNLGPARATRNARVAIEQHAETLAAIDRLAARLPAPGASETSPGRRPA